MTLAFTPSEFLFCNLGMIHRMHPSAERLFSQAKIVRAELSGPSALARALGIEPPVVANWRNRGVSAEGRVLAEQRLGIRNLWILSGKGSPMTQPEPTEVREVDTPYGGPDLAATQALGMFRRLPQSEQRDILALLRERTAFYEALFAELSVSRQAPTAIKPFGLSLHEPHDLK